MEGAWTKSGDEVLKYFDVQPELGLSKEQVAQAVAKYGTNELPAEEGKSLWVLIGKHANTRVRKQALLFTTPSIHYKAKKCSLKIQKIPINAPQIFFKRLKICQKKIQTPEKKY